MARDELVQSVTCYNTRPMLLHGYMGPFLTIYAIIVYSWLTLPASQLTDSQSVNETILSNSSTSPESSTVTISLTNSSINETTTNETLVQTNLTSGDNSTTAEEWKGPSLNDTELWVISVITIAVVQIVTYLFCHWSVHVKCFLAFNKERNPLNALWAKVVPTPNNGSSELVRIRRTFAPNNEPASVWFLFQKTKYTLNRNTGEFEPVQFPVSESFDYYLEWKGYQEESDLTRAKTLRGRNEMEMVVPLFMELFKERATAPFFVFQVFCVALWTMDEFWYYSLFTLGMLVSFEAVLVKQQLRNLSEIRKMGNKPYNINVYRNRRWTPIPSDELVAGDLVSISRSQNDNLVPCDLLLIRGTCIVDESMLTGESVPQMKEPVEVLQDTSQKLDIETNGRLHILYGGTKVIQHTAPAKSATFRASDNGCVCYVLRTGFNTSQGKLLRTILFGVKRVTANNLETFAFILFLLIFAIAAASYVWIKGSEDPKRNRYKLFLECTLILTSVVPPELPIELSLAVNTSLISLSKLYIYCTEPFRIPFAGKVDICCFDKTGTLTSDNLVVEGVAGIGGSSQTTAIDNIPTETLQVLASCNSLVQLDDGMVGDPLEKTTLHAIDWTLTKGDVVVPKKGKTPGLKIFQRFHFNSSLKRMSVICAYNDLASNESQHLVTVKGAPEVLKGMFASTPANYDQLYLNCSLKGSRVLALGRKFIGTMSHNELRNMTRDEAEKGLEFVGFLLISCPLKKDSKQMVKEIAESSHHLMMITGDAPLTACHVARELGFCRRKRTLTLAQVGEDNENDEDLKKWKWTSPDNANQYPVYISDKRDRSKFFDENDLCLTGEAMSYLMETDVKLFKLFLPHIVVFARVAPKQKEFVITTLRSLGFVTLMCGDGTNDVGALKHAHAGVALLSNAPLTPPQPLKKIRKALDEAKLNAGNLVVPGSSGVNGDTGRPQDDPRKRLVKRPGPDRPNAAVARPKTREEKLAETRAQLDKLMKEMEEHEPQIVKLGDASIAAPFTSKLGSIQCVCHIIKQGRCTLVTTLQMFKILALNALILAYSQSVLYLDGIKFSDGQATLQGLLLAGCFLCISRSKPLTVLSKSRPLPNIFNVYTVLSVMLQFAVHFASLIYLVNEAKFLAAADGPKKEETEFKPSLLNSTVYIISIGLQVSTFAVNYKGRPFMESLYENKPLLYSILASVLALFTLVSGLMPDMSSQFGIVDFPPQFQNTLMLVLIADMALAFLVDRACEFIFGYAKLRQPKK